VAVVEADAEALGVVDVAPLETPQPVTTSRMSVISVSATHGRARVCLDNACLPMDMERASALNSRRLAPHVVGSSAAKRPASV
jgi:hypothetical protein